MTDSAKEKFSKSNLDKLTAFIPAFLRDDFVFSINVPGVKDDQGYYSPPHNSYSAEARAFINTARDAGFIDPRFLDTSVVSEHRSFELRSNPEFLETASIVELANYLTFLSRMERFNDSAFSAAFREGFIISLLNRLKIISQENNIAK